MNDTFKIGLITKPHGIRGELKVTPLTDDPARFKRLKNVIIDGKNYGVLGATVMADAVFLSLVGVTDRTAAEFFRGKFLLVERKDAEPTGEFSYYISDIIGSKVVTEKGETVRFPFLRDFLVGVDVAAKTITVKEKRFGEVCVYEN